MSDAAFHIIQKQRYDIVVAKEQQGVQLHKQLQDINFHCILPALGTKLDQLFPDDEVVVIDKLNIDIGHLSSHASAEEWIEKILAGLEISVNDLNSTTPAEHVVEINKLKRSQHAIEVFINFLHTGILQSETIFSSILEVKAALMLLDDDGLAILKNELVKCTSSTIIIQRLVMLKADELSFFVRLLIPTIAENEWNNMLETVIAIIGRSAKHAETEYKKVKGSGLTASFLKNKVFYTLLLYILNAAKELRYVTVEKLMLVAKESLHRIIAEPQLDYEANNIIADEENKSALPDEKDLVEWKKDFKGFFIINAGICLLAPYLPAFFKELNLCDERSFYDKVRQQHAVYLLHYIATGEKDSSEENLVLAKILCGWPLLMPCVNMFEISVTEIDEATELLKTVIKYWTVLKNTSPDGLREGFLQRGGKFLEEDDNYILQVEQQSIDILLEQVPWTFRMIKLPWMKKMIQVEWY